MSCHDIGRGLNSVVEVVITLYDEGKLDTETARVIIAACRKGVHWCDGNEGEAVMCLHKCRCGKCLKVVEKADELLPLWETSLSWREVSKIAERENDELAIEELCRTCFDEVLYEYFGNMEDVAREYKYIIEHADED